jgi:hypothetical protein
MNAAEKVTKKVLELEADRKECLDELANSTLKGDRLYKHIMNW